MRLLKNGVLTAVLLIGFGVEAMPTAKELQGAEMIVKELMAPEVAAQKSGKKSLVDVAGAAQLFASDAKDEASRFLLMKGAFLYYMKAGEYQFAEGVFDELGIVVKELPEKVQVEMLQTGLRGVSRQKCPGLHERCARLRRRIDYVQKIADMEKLLGQKAEVKKSLRSRLGELYALTGDWKRALEAFAAGEGDTAEKARQELASADDPKTCLALADFWWSYVVVSDPDSEKVFHAHAADLYRTALKDDALDGIKRSLVKKRVVDAETSSLVKSPGNSKFQIFGNIARLQVDEGLYVEFVRCPAGSFNMLVDPVARRREKVNITHSFWIMRNWLTVRQRYGNGFKLPAAKEKDSTWLNSREECEGFVRWWTPRFSDALPEDMVLRLPTVAEWQYAVCGGTTFNVTKSLQENAWGIQHAFHKDNGEFMLDACDPPEVQKDLIGMKCLPKLASLDDPLIWSEDKDRRGLIMKNGGYWWAVKSSAKFGGFMRFVIGHDLRTAAVQKDTKR